MPRLGFPVLSVIVLETVFPSACKRELVQNNTANNESENETFFDHRFLLCVREGALAVIVDLIFLKFCPCSCEFGLWFYGTCFSGASVADIFAGDFDIIKVCASICDDEPGLSAF